MRVIPFLFLVGVVLVGCSALTINENDVFYPKPSVTPETFSLDGVTLHCWDCNHPVEEGATDAHNCRVEFFRDGDEIHFEYYDGDDTDPHFASQDGVTLGTQTLGQYMLSDVDLPFSGPFGVTTSSSAFASAITGTCQPASASASRAAPSCPSPPSIRSRSGSGRSSRLSTARVARQRTSSHMLA